MIRRVVLNEKIEIRKYTLNPLYLPSPQKNCVKGRQQQFQVRNVSPKNVKVRQKSKHYFCRNNCYNNFLKKKIKTQFFRNKKQTNATFRLGQLLLLQCMQTNNYQSKWNLFNLTFTKEKNLRTIFFRYNY